MLFCFFFPFFRDGNLQDIINQGSLHEFLVNLHQEFGSMASFWFGGRPVVSLGSVNQLKQHINPNHTSKDVTLKCLLSMWIPKLFPFFWFSADSFETMLKSLLGYPPGMGGGPNESVVRKKLYEGAINNSLKNNFPVVLKVRPDHFKWGSPQIKGDPLTRKFCLGGGGTCGKVEVIPGGSAHPAVCPPAGSGPEDRHPAGSGRALQRWRRNHLFPQEPRRGENHFNFFFFLFNQN